VNKEITEAYSAVADEQRDEIEARDLDLCRDILTICRIIFTSPGQARSLSTALTIKEGIVSRLAVPGHAPYKVFRTSAIPRAEAVLPHPWRSAIRHRKRQPGLSFSPTCPSTPPRMHSAPQRPTGDFRSRPFSQSA
jgi:hypothetical protein